MIVKSAIVDYVVRKYSEKTERPEDKMGQDRHAGRLVDLYDVVSYLTRGIILNVSNLPKPLAWEQRPTFMSSPSIPAQFEFNVQKKVKKVKKKKEPGRGPTWPDALLATGVPVALQHVLLYLSNPKLPFHQIIEWW